MSEEQDNKSGRIYCGVAGWSYPDWESVVYPRPRPRGFDPLVYLASLVDVIEINSTFYHPGPKKNAQSWARRMAGSRGFKFTVKLWQRLTHERKPFTGEEAGEARTAADVLMEAGLLGAALLQFPWSFGNNEENRAWLTKVAAAMAGLPLAVEVRHASWGRPEFYELLRELGIAFVNIDQPVIGESLPPGEEVTAGFAYARLHGRNYKNWFQEDAGRDGRYDYRYSEDELRPWKDRAQRMAEGGGEVYVVANNHYNGQAVVNALQLKVMLGRPVTVPPWLAAAHPGLFDARD
ncbi:MAG TPA: DUF72 domain-containing protein [bacterium]|nr:DUF72 domain-containing protein [bacterium]